MKDSSNGCSGRTGADQCFRLPGDQQLAGAGVFAYGESKNMNIHGSQPGDGSREEGFKQ